jgi:hypothetical protein
MPTKPVTFGQFRLDAANECLWQGTQAIPVRPKPFAVLTHLVDNHGQLVTKQQLLDAVWPATFVTDAVLKTASVSPEALETTLARSLHRNRASSRIPLHRAISSSEEAAVALACAVGLSPHRHCRRARPGGRTREDARVLELPCGESGRQFVTGEPGIGKTTLVNAAPNSGCRDLGGTRAVPEQHGAGEALPVPDGFRAGPPGGERIVELPRRHAPAWLLELPLLIRRRAGGRVGGNNARAHAREMASVEAMTPGAVIPALEDLHWADYSTLDPIAYLASPRSRALTVIGTYRPVDVS